MNSPVDKQSTTIIDDDHAVAIDASLPLRKWLYSWLFDPDIPGNHQKSVDRWISILIVANLFALLFEHVEVIYVLNQHWFHWFDVFSVAVFTVEYLLRLYLAPEDREFGGKRFSRLRYVASPFAIIDFLAVAPFYLQAVMPVDLRFLRLLRLLRILKLFRVLVPAYRKFGKLNAGRSFRQRVHALVFFSEYGGAMHRIFETFIAFWVAVSVTAVVLESVQSVHYILNVQFIILDALTVCIFTVEYCMRIYSCVEEPGFQRPFVGRLRQARTPAVVIDLLAILPFFLEVFLHHLFDLRFLRVFRLARLLKLTRYTGATSTLTRVIAREWPVISAAAFVMLLLVVLTASLGYLFEHEAQPDKFENIPQSIYWAVITLASVGYGDIYPITPAGRAMTIILALLGIGIFAIPAALFSSAFSDELTKERETLKNKLYGMLAGGIISPDATALIHREAKRLHLTQVEVDSMIEKARGDREPNAEQSADMPLRKIAERPEHAIEHYKTLLSQIRQVGFLTDVPQFERFAQETNRLTQGELSLWQRIRSGSTPEFRGNRPKTESGAAGTDVPAPGPSVAATPEGSLQ